MRGIVTLAFLVGVVASACQPPPAEQPAPMARSPHLAPLSPHEVVVLNPEDPDDRRLMRMALRRAGEEDSLGAYRWLPTRVPEGARTFGEVTAHGDDIRMREHLRSCLQYATLEAEPSGVHVVILRIHVVESGDVEEVTVRARTIPESDVVTCLMQAIMSWRFNRGADEVFDVPLALVAGR